MEQVRKWTLVLPSRGHPGEAVVLAGWQAAALIVVHLVPSLTRFALPPWALAPRDELQIWTWSTAYLLTASTWVALGARRQGLRISHALSIAIICWGAGWLFLDLRAIPHSRVVFAASGALGLLLATVPFVLVRRLLPTITLGIGAGGAVFAGQIADGPPAAQTRPPRDPNEKVFSTLLLPLRLRVAPAPVDSAPVPGGALATHDQAIILVTGAGRFFRVEVDSTGARAVPLDIPPLLTDAPALRDSLGSEPFLRVTGMAIDSIGPELVLYVAHEAWNAAGSCVAMQVSATHLTSIERPDPAPWRTFFTSEPCLSPTLNGFDGFESGGRLVVRDDHTLLLTLGDYGLLDTDGPNAQDNAGHYGKVLAISRDGRARIFSKGHRNPQGLLVDHIGRIWSTEHGPRGGDELNLLRPMGNYGWPLTTYGTEYSAFRWPLTDSLRTRGRVDEPRHAFVPSIGVSNLIEITHPALASWRHDLLLASLVAQSLYRVRLSGDRVAYVEPINVGERVRDLVMSNDGHLVLWTDRAVLIDVSVNEEVADGAFQYEACAPCHGDDLDGSDIAPSIIGILGRRVASDPEFAYSPALERLGGYWTVARLDAFLRNPAAYAPGTAMVFRGIDDARARRALIAYLSLQ